MTLSGDVPAIIKPLGMIGRDKKCTGNMYCVNCECAKKKKKKKKDLAGQVFTVESESITEIVSEENKLQSFEKNKNSGKISKDLGNGKWKFKGKVGVWRTVRGRRRFYPDDGSESYPRHGKSGMFRRFLSGIKSKFKKRK